nr:MAG: putative coat protein [Barnaviridae sp.]
MSLIVSRRGNIVPQNTLQQSQLSVAVRTDRRSRQRGNNSGARMPAQQVMLRVPQVNARVVGTGKKSRRKRRSLGAPMSVPSQFGMRFGGGQPAFGPLRVGNSNGLVVTHHELMTTVIGSSAFAALRAPMIPASFSWLDGIAKCFSRFRWRALRADFITASPTSQGGTVALGAAYDSLDVLPQSIGDLAALAHSSVVPVWSQPGAIFSTTFDPLRWSKPWYPYIASVADSQATNEYSPAYLYFGRETQVNGQPIGHIQVSYTIEFIDPIPSYMNLDEIGTPPIVSELVDGKPVITRVGKGVEKWAMPARSLPLAEPSPLDRLIEAMRDTYVSPSEASTQRLTDEA